MNPGTTSADAALAAALLWVDPHGLGGVWLRAGAGPVRDAWLEGLTALRPAGLPLLRMPAHIGDDRLLGGLDLAATLQQGRPVAQRGLLAQADGGLVLLAMAERTEPGPVARIASALDRGAITVAREGIQAESAARVGVVALDEGEGDDEALAAPLADRLAFALDLRTMSWRDAAMPWVQPGEVLRARAAVAATVVDDEVLQAIVAAAAALGVDSPRAALHAMRACRAHAALASRAAADASDASAAVRLVLVPRATQAPAAQENEEAPPEPEQPPPPDDDAARDAQDETPAEVGPLEDQIVEAALASLPPDVLMQLRAGSGAARSSRSAGRVGVAARSQRRGRPIGARRGVPRQGARLALIDTLRAAAPWQTLRRAAGADPTRVAVRPDDFHITRYRQRQATTTVFVLDASGSAALARLAEAKGAVELLLAECYVRRDEVAVLAFRGRGAELLLPPTRSLVRAKRSLAGLPGGGGTPLAAALDAARLLAERVRRSGATPAIVLLTDGRANIARNGEPGREQAAADALASARLLRGLGVAVLVVDTAVHPEPAAARLAEAIGATYLPLPQARSDGLARAAQALVATRA